MIAVASRLVAHQEQGQSRHPFLCVCTPAFSSDAGKRAAARCAMADRSEARDMVTWSSCKGHQSHRCHLPC